MVPPLPEGTRLADRFEIGRVIGRGGFSIVYDVRDLRRNDRAVLKEFVPAHATRGEDGLLDLGPSATTLRRTFLQEAQTLSRLVIPGVVPVRLAFVANATAYVASDAVLGGKTLDTVIREGGGLDPTGVLDLAYQLIETLEAIHGRGLLHRDIKPSNVLVGEDGRAYLLDFGAARAWAADALDSHTVVFTPGYAPPEQMAAVGRRGPASDVYGLCATLYAALTARPPTDATARAAGEPLAPLAELRPDLDPGIAAAIESGLALRASDRPASVGELRDLLEAGPKRDALDTLDSLDDLLMRARRFSFDRRACPACGGVLEEARPLAKDTCPVCWRGRIRMRHLEPRMCPICRHGILRSTAKRPILRSIRNFIPRGRSAEEVARGHKGIPRLQEDGLEAEAFQCDSCSARMESRPDGRWHQAHPPTNPPRDFYPEEWARIAARLDPGAGDAFCDACDADYAVHDDQITLLAAPEDPNGFADLYQGRPLPRDRVRWLAVGKSSPHPGFVCERCHTELDRDGRELRLVDSPSRRLDRLAGESRSLESWHRLAEGLPEAGREVEIEERIAHALAAAYRRGEVAFGELAWKGPVEYRDKATVLVVRDEELRLGRGFRVKRYALPELVNLRSEGDWLLAEAPDAPLEIRVEPVELVAHLRSGDRSVVVTAADLAARLAWTCMARHAFRVASDR